MGGLPVIATILVTAGITQSELEHSEKEKVKGVTREVARQVKMLMASASNDLAALTSNRVVTGASTPRDERGLEMKRLVEAYKMFDDISLYDSNAELDISTSRDNPEVSDSSRWFETAIGDNRTVISRPHRFPGQPGLHLKVYIPIEIAGEPNLSVLRARLKFKPVDDLINGVRIGERGGALLVDPRGDVMSGGRTISGSEAFGDLGDSVLSGEREGLVAFEGADYYYYGHVIEGGNTKVDEPWVVLSLLPRGEMTAPIKHAILAQALVALIVIVAAVLVGLVIAKRFAAPVVMASAAARRVSQGDLAARIPEEGAEELCQLAISFNSMVSEVRKHRSELEAIVESRTEKLVLSQRNLENTFAQLRASYEAAQEGVLVVGKGGHIIAANERVGDYFGIEQGFESMDSDDFKTHAVRCFSNAEEFTKTWTVMNSESDKLAEGEWELIAPTERVLSVYSAPVENSRGEQIARLWTFQDITEQRTLQRSLEQAQKMEAVGRLAGGVAHDFNNMLTGILGNLSLVELGSASTMDPAQAEYLEKAKGAGQRAAGLVKQLLGFSRRTHLELEYCDANEVISEVQGLLKSTIDPRIEIVTDLCDRLWSVEVDATQVEQVVMNMCVNARDAMEDKGGRITLKTSNISIDESEIALQHPLGHAGDFIELKVSDNGSGIPQELLDKIFDPFFTTKEQGKGTGLGLATSYGIVEQHGGWIECVSEVGKGTAFHIFVPRNDRPVEQTACRRANDEAPVVGGDETVLLVDDDIVVRAVAQGVLKHHGYKVIVAGDGEEALSIYSSRSDEIDLVLLDLTMPKLSGRETLAALREGYGQVPVVVCSGYLVDLEGFEQETGYRPDAAIQKPYQVDDLARRVRDVIDAAATLVA